MEKKYMIRSFLPGDEESYLELFNHVFPGEMTIDFWNWLYMEGPAGKRFIETAWDGERMVGVYGIVAVRMSRRGFFFTGALSVAAVTRPEYRYRGIFSALGKELYRRAEESGIDAVYGFPTEHSRHGFQKSLGWDHIQRGKVLVSGVSAEREAAPSGLKMYTIKSAGKEFDYLWKRLGGGILRDSVLLARDSAYVNWRFVKHPAKEYGIVLAEDSSGPAGYAAVSITRNSGEIFCNVEDIAVSGIQCFREMISHIRQNISQNGIVRIIIPFESHFYRCALSMGFRESGEKFCFGWKGLRKTEGLRGEWYYTIADWADAQN